MGQYIDSLGILASSSGADIYHFEKAKSTSTFFLRRPKWPNMRDGDLISYCFNLLGFVISLASDASPRECYAKRNPVLCDSPRHREDREETSPLTHVWPPQRRLAMDSEHSSNNGPVVTSRNTKFIMPPVTQFAASCGLLATHSPSCRTRTGSQARRIRTPTLLHALHHGMEVDVEQESSGQANRRKSRGGSECLPLPPSSGLPTVT